jgi:hypothetical protein
MERSAEQFIPSGEFIPFDSSAADGIPGDSDGARENRFRQFSQALDRDLAPRGVLERVLADRVILSAWTLREIAEKELAAIRSPQGPVNCAELVECQGAALGYGYSHIDVSPQGVSLVADCLGTTLEVLHRLRAVAPVPASPSVPTGTEATSDFERDSDTDSDPITVFDHDGELDDLELADLSNEWPVVPRGRSAEDLPDTDTGDGDPSDGCQEPIGERWRGRLCFDLQVSEDSPVIKGTWVTVSQVVSLIVDGWTWFDILRAHPELSEDDIRTSLAYTVAEERGEL